MNAKEDRPGLVSIAVPMGVQENASFIEDLDSLPDRKNLFLMTTILGRWKVPGQSFSEYKKRGAK